MFLFLITKDFPFETIIFFLIFLYSQKIFLGYFIIQFPFSLLSLIVCIKLKLILFVNFILESILSFIEGKAGLQKINTIKSKKFKEAKLLMISNNKAKRELNWKPTLNFKDTIKMTVEWYKCCFYENRIEEITRKQIEYFSKK